MSEAIRRVYGDTLIVRAPVPATVNKAGANYKSEVAHVEYSPRRAFDEWIAICEAVVAFGGDAIFDFEAVDEKFLDAGALEVDAGGAVRAAGSREVIESLERVETGRVFAANGPWVILEDRRLRALMPNLLAHRHGETAYYRRLLGRIAGDLGLELEVIDNPHRWEGMADVAVAGQRVFLTHTVEGRYDAGVGKKTMRSSRAGVEYAAKFAGLEADEAHYLELVFPHFHGDTVHFGARPPGREPVLVHYRGGLVAGQHVGGAVLEISREDAVEKYAGNSRQVRDGVLVPDGVSDQFIADLSALGLSTRKVPLFELFGKAGGGPACATLYLPANLRLPANHPLRYSMRRKEVAARRERLAETLRVDPGFFAGKQRG